MSELHELSATEQRDELRAGHIDPVELTEHYLERIERLNDGLGAFVTVTADAARRRAAHVRDTLERTVPLWGMPFGDKDLTQREGVATRFGSRLFADFVPETSDEIVETMDAAGGVSLGKTATPEFGLPSYTEPVASAPARNPWDTTLGAGGSSGGAAVAVASGMLPFAPGSDGGGSVRIPAAACGLVGIKPSRGRVPAGSGIAALGGLPVAGPIARTVADAALLLDGMITGAGTAAHHYALRAPGPDGPMLDAATRGEGRYRLAAMTTSAWDGDYEITVAPEAHAALDAAVAEFAAIGHDIEQTALRADAGYVPAFRTIWQTSAASLPVEGKGEELLEPLTRWLMHRGRELTARELAEALGVLRQYERDFIAQFAAFDAVLTPTLAMTPRPVGWYDADDGEHNFVQQCQYTPFTSMVNVTGLPAITLPVTQTEGGLPMGVQLIGRPGGEDVLLALGAQLEARVGWQRRHPPGW